MTWAQHGPSSRIGRRTCRQLRVASSSCVPTTRRSTALLLFLTATALPLSVPLLQLPLLQPFSSGLDDGPMDPLASDDVFTDRTTSDVHLRCPWRALRGKNQKPTATRRPWRPITRCGRVWWRAKKCVLLVGDKKKKNISFKKLKYSRFYYWTNVRKRRSDVINNITTTITTRLWPLVVMVVCTPNTIRHTVFTCMSYINKLN